MESPPKVIGLVEANMARKLIDQDEAARILGVTPEEVGSLRDRKKLFPYRDGDQWKFKQEDVERLRDDMQAEKSDTGVSWENTAEADTGDSEEIELQMSDDLDSILLSEIELGKSGSEGPSTIIGKHDKGAVSEEDDFNIITDKPAANAPDAGDVTLASSSGLSFGTGTGSGLGDSGLSLGGSDVQLAATGSEVSKQPGSSDKLFGSDALKLSDDELSLVAPAKAPGDSSKKGPGSSIVKLDDEDSESALGATSDVTLSPTDSGIQLISASDSGLSLDEPVELGSSAKKLLELSDEDVISLEEAPAGSSVAMAGEKADDEFLLTAVDEGIGDESDSGSQVIALDAEEELSSGMFAPVAQTTSMLEEEPSAALGAPTMAAASPLMGGAPAGSAVAAEAPFTTLNVLALSMCVVLLLLCGMMAYDLMRNMWSWDGPYTVNSSILESFGSWLGK